MVTSAARELQVVDKRLYKKCIKCRAWKPREDILNNVGEVEEKHGFGAHETSSDALQSICFACKNKMNNTARDKNITARIRHHTSTRCLTQLGKSLTPLNFVANLEDYLGYKIATLVKHLSQDLKRREGPKRKLRDALVEGYHLDHIRPLSLYKVVCSRASVVVVGEVGQYVESNEDRVSWVDWEQFRLCWAMENLTAIPGAENLAKGAKYTPTSADIDQKKGLTSKGADKGLTSPTTDHNRVDV